MPAAHLGRGSWHDGHMDLKLRRLAALALDAADPLRLAARLPLAVPNATLLLIYRERNTAIVDALVRQATAAGMEARLWALDRAAPALDSYTIGTGSGSRFGLINLLAQDVPSERWLIVSDDDVKFGRGGLRAFLSLAARLRLQLAQPAHAIRGSYYFHRITGRHALRVGRETTFVEIGPVLAISPDARRMVLPFPDEGMGWGTELLWYDLYRSGKLRLGIIDSTPIKHLAPAGTDYDRSGEDARQEAMFAERGITGYKDVQHNVRSLYR